MPPDSGQIVVEIRDVTDLGQLIGAGSNPLMVFQYLSYWAILLIVFNNWTHRYVNLLFLSACVFVISLYIVYVSPGYIKYYDGNKTYHIVGQAKIMLDLIGHVLPLAYVIFKYMTFYLRKDMAYSIATSNAFLIILVYLALFDVGHLYDVNDMTFGILCVVCVASYILFFNYTSF